MNVGKTLTVAVVVVLVVSTAGAGIVTAQSDATNSPPTADAGVDQTVSAGETVELDASGSTDPDEDDTITHVWTQTDGPSVALSDRYMTTPTFTAPAVDAETTLTFEVEARDDADGTDTDTVDVTVVPTNDPPTADAGEDLLVESAERVDLDAGGSTDPEGAGLSHEWRQVAGTGVVLVDDEAAHTSFTAPAVDSRVVLVFELTATDGDDASDTDVINVTVTPADRPTYTRDEIAQAKWGYDFDELSSDSAREIEELYLRQPFPEGTSPGDLATRDRLAQERYGELFDELDRNATVDVQSAYDAQLGDTGEGAAHARDEIAQAKWGYDFDELSSGSAGEIEELYDRQPFAGDLSPPTVRTRGELSEARWGVRYARLSRDSLLTIERSYDAQFDPPTGTADFSVTDVEASDDGEVVVSADVTNDGSAPGTQTLELRVDRNGDGIPAADEETANESLGLGPNATGRVSFTLSAADVGDGSTVVGVWSANDSRWLMLDVEPSSTVGLDDSDGDPLDTSVDRSDDGDDGDDGDDAFISDPAVRDGETVVTTSGLQANHRYYVDLGDSVEASDVTFTGGELMLVRGDDDASFWARASTENDAGDGPALAGSLAYLYLEADGLADEDVREVDLEFTVPLSTLDAAGVEPADVRLYRFHDGQWESYETVHLGDGRFEARNVPGFSTFAVGPEGASVVASTTPTPTPEPTETPSADTTRSSTDSDADADPAPATSTSTSTASVTAADTTPAPTAAQSTTSTEFPGLTPITALVAVILAALLAGRLYSRR